MLCVLRCGRYSVVLLLAGVSALALKANTGPLPPDGLDVLKALLSNTTSPQTPGMIPV